MKFPLIHPTNTLTRLTDDRQAAIFAHLSNGNNPISYAALNKDAAILVPTVGTGGVRDPYLASAPDDSKFWIIATDLDIDAIGGNWDTATRYLDSRSPWDE